MTMGWWPHPHPSGFLTIKGSQALLTCQLLVGDQEGLSELQVCFSAKKSQRGKNETTLQGKSTVNSAIGPMGQKLTLIVG